MKYAIFTFVGEADHWWTTMEESEPEMSWQRFLEVFYGMYFPDSMKEQKAKDFINLK